MPEQPEYHPDHPLGCHRPRISERIVFDKMLQLLRCSCSYQAIADTTCSATTIRNRRNEWIRLGIFARLKQIALEYYGPDRRHHRAQPYPSGMDDPPLGRTPEPPSLNTCLPGRPLI